MTVRDLYTETFSDFDSVLKRLGSEESVKKFVRLFAGDESFTQLKTALSENNTAEAFRAAHTLKGISINLGFSGLYKASSGITESLRNGQTEDLDKEFSEVCWEYEKLISRIPEID